MSGITAALGRAARLSQHVGLYAMLLLAFSNAAVEISFGFLMGGWLVERALNGWHRSSLWGWPSARSMWPWLAGYTAVCGLSILWSVNPTASAIGFIGKTLEYTGLFLAAAELGREPSTVRRALVIFALGACIIAVDGLLQQRLGYDPLRHYSCSEFIQMTGPFKNPNSLSIYLVLATLTVAGVASGRRALRWQIGWWALTGALLLCLVSTKSDAAMGGFLVGAACLALCDRSLRRGFLMAAAVLALVVGAKLLRQVSIVSGLSTAIDSGWDDRRGMWATAWNMIKVHPVLGHGLNTFMGNYMHYVVGKAREPKYAHNTLLQVTAETGIIGLALFLGLMASILACWARTLRRVPQQDHDRWMLAGPACALIGFLSQSLVETSFYSLRPAVLFWCLAGLTTGRALATLPAGQSRTARR